MIQFIYDFMEGFIFRKKSNLLLIYYKIKLTIKEVKSMSPNNSGNVMRLEIKQKSTHTKKRKVKTWSP